MAELTDEQKDAVRAWCAEGADLNAVQTRLDEEYGVRLTFLDTRMLIADLGAEAGASEREKERRAAAEKEAREKAEREAEQAAAEEEAVMAAVRGEGAVDEDDDDLGMAQGGGLPPEPELPEASGSVSVTVSSVTPPGMMIAGTVTFGDGESADWYLDQMGRLGMNPKNPDHRPSEGDLMAFQKELQETIRKQGI